jgi:hypothetical protein
MTYKIQHPMLDFHIVSLFTRDYVRGSWNDSEAFSLLLVGTVVALTSLFGDLSLSF